MNERKLIYSKRYINTPLDKYGLEKADTKTISSGLPDTADDFLKALKENTSYVLNEEKGKRKSVFLDTVNELCEAYEIDVDVFSDCYGYVANLKMHSAMYTRELKELIVKALDISDNFDLLKPTEEPAAYDFLLCLTYYTHDRYFKGKLCT